MSHNSDLTDSGADSSDTESVYAQTRHHHTAPAPVPFNPMLCGPPPNYTPPTLFGNQPQVMPGALPSRKFGAKTDPDGVQILCEKRLDNGQGGFAGVDWVEAESTDKADKAEQASLDDSQFAIVVRRKLQNTNEKNSPLYFWSVTIQSPLLKPLIYEIFKDYPGLALDPVNPTFDTPLSPFFFRWEQWKDATAKLVGARAQQHLKLLQTILDRQLKGAFEAHKKAMEEYVITHEHVWTLFKPGELIYTKDQGGDSLLEMGHQQMIYLIANMGSPQRYVRLMLREINYNESVLRYSETETQLWTWQGYRKINELDAYPLAFHPEGGVIKEKLIVRGRHFSDLNSGQCFTYEGKAKMEDKVTGCERDLKLKDRVVIDAGPLLGRKPARKSPRRTKRHATMQAQRGLFGTAAHASGWGGPGIPPPNGLELVADELTDDQLAICGWEVWAYATRHQAWVKVHVDKLREATWDQGAFDNLALPRDYRDLIQATIKMQLQGKGDLGSFINTKGKGFIMLLSGPPGVGKTSSVEAISELLRVPLCSVNTARLGVTPEDVEENLQKMLTAASRWRAIVMLDEVDRFLEQRATNDLVRNGIVTTAVRLLEDFDGILCMTSNRTDVIDSAILSRVNLSLRYPDLDRAAREAIWRRLATAAADRAANSDGGAGSGSGSSSSSSATNITGYEPLTDAQFATLAEARLDGRQIRNVFKTAALLAAWKSQPMDYDCLSRSLDIVRKQL